MPIEVTHLRPGVAEVEPVGWQARPDLVYAVDVATGAVTGITVTGDDPLAARIRAAIATTGPHGRPSPYVALAADADLRVEVTPGRVRIHHRAAIRPVADMAAGSAVITRTIRVLERVARWQQLLHLENPAGDLRDGVRLELVRNDDEVVQPEADGIVRLGYQRSAAPSLRFRLHNTTDQRLYCALVTLTETFGAHTTLLHGAWIDPGRTATASYGRPMELVPPRGQRIRRGQSFSTYIKLVTATESFGVRRYHLSRQLDGHRNDAAAQVTSPNPPITGTQLSSREWAPAISRSRDGDSAWSAATVRIDVRR